MQIYIYFLYAARIIALPVHINTEQFDDFVALICSTVITKSYASMVHETPAEYRPAMQDGGGTRLIPVYFLFLSASFVDLTCIFYMDYIEKGYIIKLRASLMKSARLKRSEGRLLDNPSVCGSYGSVRYHYVDINRSACGGHG